MAGGWPSDHCFSHFTDAGEYLQWNLANSKNWPKWPKIQRGLSRKILGVPRWCLGIYIWLSASKLVPHGVSRTGSKVRSFCLQVKRQIIQWLEVDLKSLFQLNSKLHYIMLFILIRCRRVICSEILTIPKIDQYGKQSKVVCEGNFLGSHGDVFESKSGWVHPSWSLTGFKVTNFCLQWKDKPFNGWRLIFKPLFQFNSNFISSCFSCRYRWVICSEILPK